MFFLVLQYFSNVALESSVLFYYHYLYNCDIDSTIFLIFRYFILYLLYSNLSLAIFLAKRINLICLQFVIIMKLIN
jgi:hypothetical protein